MPATYPLCQFVSTFSLLLNCIQSHSCQSSLLTECWPCIHLCPSFPTPLILSMYANVMSMYAYVYAYVYVYVCIYITYILYVAVIIMMFCPVIVWQPDIGQVMSCCRNVVICAYRKPFCYIWWYSMFKRTSTMVSVNIVNTLVFTCISVHGLLLLVWNWGKQWLFGNGI